MAVTIINPDDIPDDLVPGRYCCRLDESSTLLSINARFITPPRPHQPGDCLIQAVKTDGPGSPDQEG